MLSVLEKYSFAKHFSRWRGVFPVFSVLIPNKSKYESRKWCSRMCSLIIRANKTLGVSFSFNKQIENDEIFMKHDIEKGLHLWWVKNLTIRSNIAIFKTLTLSRISYCYCFSYYCSKSNILRTKKDSKQICLLWRYS